MNSPLHMSQMLTLGNRTQNDKYRSRKEQSESLRMYLKLCMLR